MQKKVLIAPNSQQPSRTTNGLGFIYVYINGHKVKDLLACHIKRPHVTTLDQLFAKRGEDLLTSLP